MTVVLSSALVAGQTTFIIRIIVEALSYGSLFLLPFIILAQAPRVAPLQTHDLLNRIVGSTTFLGSSLKWLVRRGSRKHPAYPPPFQLQLAIALFLVYRILVSISDVSLIGIQQCDIPYPDTPTFFASVESDEDAVRIVKANLMPDKDPNTVLSLRCNGATYQVIDKPNNFSGPWCNSWLNSTYCNSTGFRDINSTDSDVFMPRLLSHFEREDGAYTNSFIRRIDGGRIAQPVLVDGIAIEPHTSGVRAVAGVPRLERNQRVVIPKTLAIEAEVACMSMGVEISNELSAEDPLNFDNNAHIRFYTTGKWRDFYGPGHFYDALERAVDGTRQEIKSAYFSGVPDLGGVIHNTTKSIDSWFLGDFSYYTSVSHGLQDEYIISNCTQQIHEQLGVAHQNLSQRSPDPIFFGAHKPHACTLLQLTGSNNALVRTSSSFICASSTQVNMVEATVAVDQDGRLTTNLVHLPSDLWIVNADLGVVVNKTTGNGNKTQKFVPLDNVLRYTLSDNDNGPLTHPILQESTDAIEFDTDLIDGAGSAGPMIAQLGSRMITLDDSIKQSEYPLGVVDGRLYQTSFSAETLTKWAGEMGASYIHDSIGYNGWAARNVLQGAGPLTIVSTGGRNATCFDLRYGIALLPLCATAILVLSWSIWVVARGSAITESERVKSLYGGLGPYTSVVAAKVEEESPMIGVWEHDKTMRLDLLVNGQPVEGHKSETLAEYTNRVTS